MPRFGIFHKNKRLIGVHVSRIFGAMFLLVAVCVSILANLARAAEVPVRSVEIFSEHSSYINNEPGSWKITKSAEWMDAGKARITFEVESVAKYDESKNLDVLMVIDNSGSMSGDKLNQVKADATDLMNVLLSNSSNRAALVTFESSAQIISGFTNNKVEMVDHIESITTTGCTNYNQGYIKALEVLDGYTRRDNTELVMLFLTDGAPNEEVSNEIAQYKTLKTLYPYMIINGIQYEMGDTILQPIINVSDYQYIATMTDLNNVLFEATIIPYMYDNFVITDYIDNAYWNVTGISAINASLDTVTLTYDGSTPVVTWDMSGLYRSGSKQTLTIDIDLKNELYDQDLLLPTNTHETVESSILDTPDEDIDSNLTPILKSTYDVIYDANTPSDCELAGAVPATTAHTVFTTVEISDNVVSCSGYIFKSWQIATSGVSKINEDYFRMPGGDVVIKAIWSKPSISKSMDGDMHIRATAVFGTGQDVNTKLKRLSGQSDAYYNRQNDTITAVERVDSLSVSADINDSAYVISASDSMTPIYAWYDEGAIYYYTDAEEIYLNTNASSMFREMRGLASVDSDKWITSNTTTMSYMFYQAGYNAGTFELNLSNWDTSSVVNMNSMLRGAGHDSTTWSVGDLSNWNTSSVTDAGYMFYGAGYSASDFLLDLSSWDTSNVTNMGGMFSGVGHDSTTWSVGDLSEWSTSNVANMSGMFSSAGYNATTWSIGDLSEWNTSNVTKMDHMFSGAANNAPEIRLDLSSWDTSNVTDMTNMFGSHSSNDGYFGKKATFWSIGDISSWDVSRVTSFSCMFGGAGYAATNFSLDLSNWNTASAESMWNMFSHAGFSSVNFSLDVSRWNTASVANMGWMFYNAGQNATTWSIDGLSMWDTSNVTNMGSMFSNAGYKATNFSLDLSSWNTSKVADMSLMFSHAGCYATTWSIGDLSGWDTSSVTNMRMLFYYAGYSATIWSVGDIFNWNISNVTSMDSMFSNAGYDATVFELDLSGWNTSSVTSMSSMFYYAGYRAETWSVGGLSAWDTSNVTNMGSMFYNAGYNSTTWSVGDLSNWDTSSVTNMSGMFSSAGHSATIFELDLSGWDTSSVTSMREMFRFAGNKATTWSVGDLSNWDTSSVTNMDSMFYSAGYNTTTWSIGDLSKWDTSSVTSMGLMFSGAGNYSTTWSVGDISNWDTSSVTSMGSMFSSAGCEAMSFELDLSHWDTSNVTNMDHMFSSAGYKATNFSLDLSSWNTSNVTDMDYMLYNAGHNATSWSMTIPATNGAGIENTVTRMYGNSTSVYVTALSSRPFTIATE